jgi:hypothetical protein
MRKHGKLYVNLSVLFYDLAIAMKYPMEFISTLEGSYKFKTGGADHSYFILE